MAAPFVIPDQSPAELSIQSSDGLRLEVAECCLCDAADDEPLAVGEDFEYHTSRDTYLAVRCRGCGLVYLKLRPTDSELSRVYPPSYHAFDFSATRYGLAYTVRRRLEARRLLAVCRGLPADARILDVGCGDGFHLKLLREFGPPGWTLEGVDTSPRAVEAARAAGLSVRLGSVEEVASEPARYDLALLIATIEHVSDPVGVLGAVRRLLRPGGRVVVATDNAASWSFRLFKGRYWGGYHFPRHWYLFSPTTIARLAECAGFEVERLGTMVSPVNWTFSIRNALVDWHAPNRLVERFSLGSPVSLGLFTLVGMAQQLFGRGELLEVVLRRPVDGVTGRSSDAR